MSAEALLSRLDRVRKTGSSSWTARCPAHADKSPSLSVRETDDGHVLAYCHAQCGIDAIASAVGIDLADLFPPKPEQHSPPLRRPFPAADVLECLSSESAFVLVCASTLRQGEKLSDEDHQRLLLAIERIEQARRMALGE